MRRTALRICFLGGVFLLCGLLLRRVELERVWNAVRSADVFLIAIAVFLNVVINLSARTMRWAALLERLPHSGRGAVLSELYALLVASYASSNVLPGRAGEALRTFELNRRHDYPVAALIAAQMIEKVVEGLSMAAIALFVLGWAQPARGLRTPVLGLAALGLGSTALVIAVAKGFHRWGGKPQPVPAVGPTAFATRQPGQRLRLHLAAFLHRLSEAVHLLHSGRVWRRALSYSFLSDFVDVGMLGLCLLAVGIHVGAVGWLLIFLTVNLAIVVPSTPGQLGIHEASMVLVLGVLGVEQNVALAGALIYHAVHVVPTTAIGLICLRTQFLRAKDLPLSTAKT